jgi:hypothetical protein
MMRRNSPWRRRAAGAAFGFAAMIFQTPVQAQFYGGWGPYYPLPVPAPAPRYAYPEEEQPGDPPIPPATIRKWVSEMGLRLVAAPRKKGRIYLAETEDPQGQRRRVVFDAFDGTIIQNVPLGARPKPAASLAAPNPAKEAPPDLPKPRPSDLSAQPSSKPARQPAATAGKVNPEAAEKPAKPQAKPERALPPKGRPDETPSDPIPL